MRPNASPAERFDGWFVKPIEKLKKLPGGDGGFAAMMIAIPLYERYIVGKLKLEGRPTGEEEIRNEIAADLRLNDHQRSVFWEIFRNGFMHQAMPKAGKTEWVVSDKYGELPEFKTYQGCSYVCLDPWKFVNRVLDKFKQDSRLIIASEGFPLADVFLVSAASESAGTSGTDLKDFP